MARDAFAASPWAARFVVQRLESRRPGRPKGAGIGPGRTGSMCGHLARHRLTSCSPSHLQERAPCESGAWLKPEGRPLEPLRAAMGMLPGPVAAWSLAYLKPGVLAATAWASCKLCLACAAVGYLTDSNRLPASAPKVLSQVAFKLLIPCMLFTKVVTALALNPEAPLLFIPASAAVLAAVGLGFGLLAGAILERGVFFFRTAPMLRPIKPARSAESIAATTAAAFGNPAAALVLVQKPQLPPQGLTEMLVAACGFGDSFTLPLVFMLALLPAALADSATAYVALFLLGWSPCFWSIGFAMLTYLRGRERNGSDSLRVASPFDASLVPAANPRVGRMYTKARQRGPVLDTGMGSRGTQMGAPSTPKARLVDAIQSCQAFLREFASRVVNPPLIAILAAVAVGLSPLGKVLCLPAGHPEVAQWGGHGLGAMVSSRQVLGVLQVMWDGLCVLGSSALVVQTIVLATSILQAKDNTATAARGQLRVEPVQKGWRRLLLPADALESRALLLVSIVRLFVMPLVGLAAAWTLSVWGLLPQDPICCLAVLLQCVMPSAQNL
ncbi:unnamed protein product, partial [Ostreobium quekettii]